MKFKSFISLFFLLALALSATAQRRINPEKQLRKSPGNDPGYILRSNSLGEYDDALLDDLLPLGIDSVYCTADSCFLIDSDGNLHFTGLAHVVTIDSSWCTTDSCFIMDSDGNVFFTGVPNSGKTFRFSTDNFATYTPSSPALTVGTSGFDQRKGCLVYYNGSSWQDKEPNNGEASNTPYTVVNNDTLTGWNISTHNHAQLTISAIEPDSVWIIKPTNYLSQIPGERAVVDVWNSQLADTLTVFWDTLYRKFDQSLLVSSRIPPGARVHYTFIVEPSLEGVAWICPQDLNAGLVGIEGVETVGNNQYINTSNGQQLFSGLADFPQNRGRIIYVSKSGWRGTGTEEVGNPERPYKTPWAARAVMGNGDLVYVFKDIYTMGCLASGADKEASSNDSTFAINKNWLDTSYFYFEPGTLFKTGSCGGPLFTNTSSAIDTTFLRVAGGVSLDASGMINNYCSFYVFASNNLGKWVDIRIDYDRIINSAWNAARINGNYIINGNSHVFETNATNFNLYDIGIAAVVANARKSKFVFNIKDVTYIAKTGNTPSNESVLQFYSLDSANVVFNIDNLIHISRTPAFKFAGAPTSSPTFKNSQLSFNIKNAYCDDPVMKSLSKDFILASTMKTPTYSSLVGTTDTLYVGCFFTARNGTSTCVNNNLVFRIGNFTSARTLVGNAQDNTNKQMFFIDNYTQMRKAPLLLNSTSQGQTTTGNVDVWVGNTHATSALVVDTENHFNFTVSGKLQVASGPIFQNYSSSTTRKRSFLDARLINAGLTAPLASSSAISCEIMNCFSNSTVIDSNVTELIEPLKRNSNVR